MGTKHSFGELQKLISGQIEIEARKIGQMQPANLYQPIGYTLDMGGKRLRPAMLLLACGLFSGDIKKAMPAAIAVEIFHNFTLLHDDIMDHADIRRNKPSVHKKYNENIAILSGDAMSILAYQYLLKTESNNLQKIIQLFSQTAIEVCEGQQYDMDYEEKLEVNIDHYLKMIRLKTAVLIACSLKMGAWLANAPDEDAEKIYQFGINLGLAFQLQDDLLDVFADQEKFGKTLGGDIIANKKTYLLLKAMEIAGEEQKAQLTGWFTKRTFDPKEKVEAVKRIYSELNIPATSKQKAEKYYQLALKELQAVAIENEYKEQLFLMAKTIMKREH
jgi:geranylgeranyl diphosphate synthase type II